MMILVLMAACKQEKPAPLTAQQIVDSAIAVSGGPLYKSSQVSFEFRDRAYRSFREDGRRVLIRETATDSGTIRDIRDISGFRRYLGDSLLTLADTTALKYSNSVNSVHYFAYLPYGLNDKAVKKELLGKSTLNEKSYYKVRVTFQEEGGGEDFEDIFIYWFNTDSYRPDYLAYEFHTNGGGMRFREAYNDREVGGIRFQDYVNYKPAQEVPVEELDRWFEEGRLEELSRIELKALQVRPAVENQ